MEMGYRPNAAARTMTRGSFGAVSFVTCGDLGTDWYPISGLNGIHSTLDKRAWRLIFNELPASVISSPELVPNLFRETSVDGLLINLLPAFTSEVADYFESQPLPCVWLNLKRRRRAVYPDEASGATMGVEWLTQRGYQKIGFFTRQFIGPLHFSVNDRFAGFQEAMRTRRLAAHRHFEIISGEAETMPLFDRAKLFINTFKDLQAVVCYELEEAVCMQMAAECLGLKPGKDFAIIGYAEREIRSTTALSIPTLIVPFHELGCRAVEMLELMIETHRQDVDSVQVPFRSILI